MKINTYQKIFLSGYVGVVLLWVYIQMIGSKDGDINYWYSFLFGLIPLFGGIIGMIKSGIWGRLSSVLGKAIFFFSLGLFLWGFGETIWSYYNFFENEPAPYPSIADFGFAPSIFFWIIGSYFLAKASGAIYLLKRSTKAKAFAVVTPLILSAVAYYMLVEVARKGTLVPEGETPLKVVLDIAYPLGDFLALTFAVVGFTLASRYLGGRYRNAIACVMLGLTVMYFADFLFSYTTTAGTFYNANPGDLMLATGTFLMTFGILGFATRPQQSSSRKRGA